LGAWPTAAADWRPGTSEQSVIRTLATKCWHNGSGLGVETARDGRPR
jgi:hypothetical protein